MTHTYTGSAAAWTVLAVTTALILAVASGVTGAPHGEGAEDQKCLNRAFVGQMFDRDRYGRRHFLQNATVMVAAAELAVLTPVGAARGATQTTAVPSLDTAIRPFRVRFPHQALTGLHRRIAATRWPEKETVADGSQGVPLALMQDVTDPADPADAFHLVIPSVPATDSRNDPPRPVGVRIASPGRG